MLPPRFHKLKVTGDNFAIGKAIGKHFSPKIKAVLEFSRTFYPAEFGVSFEEAVASSDLVLRLEFAEKELPQFVDELKGVAEGAKVPFSELFMLNAQEFLFERKRRAKGCTTVFYRDQKHFFIGHNEDWLADFSEKFYVLEAHIENKFDTVSFISLLYYGDLPGYSASLNSHGFATTSNGVFAKNFAPGTPKSFVNRYILESANIKEAIRKANSLTRASGTTLNLAHGNEFVSMEINPASIEVIRPEADRYVHTNHYLSKSLETLGVKQPNSLRRIERANQLLAMVEKPGRNFIHSVLADHENSPHSICSHSADLMSDKKKSATLASVIIEPTEKRFSILKGSPCRGKYSDYYI